MDVFSIDTADSIDAVDDFRFRQFLFRHHLSCQWSPDSAAPVLREGQGSGLRRIRRTVQRSAHLLQFLEQSSFLASNGVFVQGSLGSRSIDDFFQCLELRLGPILLLCLDGLQEGSCRSLDPGLQLAVSKLSFYTLTVSLLSRTHAGQYQSPPVLRDLLFR